MTRFMIFIFGTTVVATLLAAAPVGAGQSAQVATGTSIDARWLPWIGCWRPANQRSPEEGLHMCVVPAGPNGVKMMTIAGDRAVIEETIVPDATSRPVDDPACRGSHRAAWSTDGQRVYLGAELTCDEQPARKVSGLSALTADGEWIDVQVVMSGARESVRVRRYQRSSDTPPDASLIPADLAARAATSAHGTRLTIEDVIEASSKVAPRTLEALLFETKAHFPIDSRQLIAMDDAGVDPSVIDVMVALSFPRKFEVKRSTGTSSLGGFGWSDLGWGGLGLSAEYAWPWSYNPYYAYSSFGPVGYSYWNLGSGYYDPGSSVIVGDGTSTPSEGHGRVVNGSGYTQVVLRAPDSAAQSGQRLQSGGDSSAGSGADSGSSSGGASGASSGGYSSGGGGGDSGRTAVPR